MTLPESEQDVRAGGVLLHPTSLPSSYGIGDFGPDATDWIAWLAETGCTLWQVLPLGPTGYGDSPYQSFSAFAGNPLLISPQCLFDEGLLLEADFTPQLHRPGEGVDYAQVIASKGNLLERACERFRAGHAPHLEEAYQAFLREHADWLEDYVLFMALKGVHAGAPWTAWDAPLAHRDPQALTEAAERLSLAVENLRLQQFFFFTQWGNLRRRTQEAGIQILGDVPLYIAHDSADVWAHPEFFTLDTDGEPDRVAGVPPDYFSPTGQRWGNPLYRWDRLLERNFDWWVRRVQVALSMLDLVRLDHFRGFEAYWEIPAGAPTAESGRWVPGPGTAFFDAMHERLGRLPFVAEDLGIITPEVAALREAYDLPGMKVLQFAFTGDLDHAFLPHNYPRRCVAYTGTHDNDTVVGWFANAEPEVRAFCCHYLQSDGTHIAWDFIRAIWESQAGRVVAPMQDFLELGSEARMNFPGRGQGNWRWRLDGDLLSSDLAGRIRALNGRCRRG